MHDGLNSMYENMTELFFKNMRRVLPCKLLI